MKVTAESGFTLTEMLVALMVLGVTASAISTSMGTAFNSYGRLSKASDDLRTDRQLQSVFTDVSNGFWLANGELARTELTSLELSHPHFQKLEIVEINGDWKLIALATGFDPVSVYQSDQPLRISALGAKSSINMGRQSQYDYHTIKLEKQAGDWKDVIAVPLKVDADPECRFDIVGRRCR